MAAALLSLLLTGCLMGRGPSIGDHLARVQAPEEPGPEILIWDGWHPIDVNGPVRDRLVAAHQLAEEGYLSASLSFLESLARAHPDVTALHEARGVLEARLGFPRAAEREFERSLQSGARRPELWYALGRIRLDLQLPVAALESLRRAQDLGADGVLLHREMARALRAMDRWSEAAVCYDEALARDGGPRSALLVEAATLVVDCRARRLAPPAWEKAFAFVDEAGKLDPSSPEVWFVRGLLSECRNDFAAAIVAYESALERDPYNLAALTNLALAARRTRDGVRCADAAQRALALEPDSRRRALLEDLLTEPPGVVAGRDH